MQAERQPTRLERFETGVPGLDDVLLGGFFRGGVNLVLGPPGSGKTVLAGQVAFHHARAGRRAVYLTVLTEPHGRMIEHLRTLRFFDEALIPDALYFVSGYRELEQDGLPGLLRVIQGVVRERRASLLVLDGLSVVAGLSSTAIDLQRFVYELNTLLSALGCTAILLSTGGRLLAEEAMVESITVLDVREAALRSVRELRVTKLRGGGHLDGVHQVLITDEGVRVYPRLEAIAARRALAATSEAPVDAGRLAFGVRHLDEMLDGGIPALTSTTLLGAPGSGKTVLGTSFLVAGAEAGERGLYFGFFETPDRLVAKLDALGLPLRAHVDRGLVDLRWFAPVERLADSLAVQLLDAVRAQGATRVLVDGVDGFRRVAADPERLPGFLVALTRELRALGATVLFTEESDLFRHDLVDPLEGLAATIDNILFLRYVELHARLHRMLSILKLRDGAYDGSLREFRIAKGGFAVAETFATAEMVMTGVARARTGERAPRRARARAGRRTAGGRRR
jgi:circadian clock protein KaiC